MNSHVRRALLTYPWVGIALAVIGACCTIYPLIFTGFGLIFSFVALVLWAKKSNPMWYTALK